MLHVWQEYLNSVDDRKNPTAVPMVASLDLLKGLPPALVITAETDILRDEGEKYAKRLQEAGVPVVVTRYISVGHSFLTQPALSDDALAVVAQTANTLRRNWLSGPKL